MMLIDRELVVQAFREVQLILSDSVEPGPQKAQKTVQYLLQVLDCGDVVEALDRI